MPAGEYVLEMFKVSKQFPGVKALDEVELRVKKGEVHALVGENGAGKSTLMKIISGVYQPDGGDIYIEGEKVQIKNPLNAENLGVSIVYQELNVFSASSVAENIYVNRLPRKKSGLIDYKILYLNTEKILKRFGLDDIDYKSPVRDLSIGRQQMVEIMRASSQDAKLLILDEPTSALTEKETNLLFDIIRTLKSSGVSVIYISHRLEEIFQVCERVTVLRDGKYIETLNVADTNKDEIVKLMVGRDVVYNYGVGTSEIKDTVLEVKNLTYGKTVKDVSFELRKGEILGIAGLEGAGRTELVQCIFGVKKMDQGAILIDGKNAKISSPVDAKKLGMAYITKDRKTAGLFLRLSVNKNIMSGNLDNFSRHSIIDYKKAKEMTWNYVDKFNIKTPDINKLVLNLSGGNQQKVLLAMWLIRNPRILIIDEPTRGIDVGTKEDIHKLLRNMAKEGASIIMISSDMPELIGASDRIMAMYEGCVTGFLDSNEVNEEKIMRLTSGEVIC